MRTAATCPNIDAVCRRNPSTFCDLWDMEFFAAGAGVELLVKRQEFHVRVPPAKLKRRGQLHGVIPPQCVTTRKLGCSLDDRRTQIDNPVAGPILVELVGDQAIASGGDSALPFEARENREHL